jgi:hypothetical protein
VQPIPELVRNMPRDRGLALSTLFDTLNDNAEAIVQMAPLQAFAVLLPVKTSA